MRFAEFQRLAGLGEGQHIDRKIECHAFASRSPDSDGAKAELAKDICAMGEQRQPCELFADWCFERRASSESGYEPGEC